MAGRPRTSHRTHVDQAVLSWPASCHGSSVGSGLRRTCLVQRDVPAYSPTMRNRHLFAWSALIAAALIPVVLLLGHERPYGCEHPSHYPCDPRSSIPGWVGPVVVALFLWAAVVGLGVALVGAKRWGQSQGSAVAVARTLRWSAVGAAAVMPAVMWSSRSRQTGCEAPVVGPCDVLVVRPTWTGRVFFGLCLWLVASLVFAAVLDHSRRVTEDA
jgi:hypothetical protein